MRRTVLIAIIALCGFTVISLALNSLVRIPNGGRIKSIGVEFYWDSQCTVKVTQIDWGMVTPGETYNTTLFCKNIKNSPVTLSLSIDNWNPPEASNYIHTNWNYTYGTVINPGAVYPILFELSIDENITGIDYFSFDYIINAEG